ncbi:MAG: ATPase [Acutalibacteraceae bacterium]|jgi:F0F1-type ATP synthase membrane subunit b/b'
MSMKVDELLDQIDDMVDKAVSVPLSGGKCLIPADQLRDIVDDIRANLPSELRQAQAIVADRGDIVANAKREAEEITRAAEERARAMISKEEIVVASQQKANEILVAAQQRSRDMRKGANDFADDVLKSTEELLTKRVSELRQARQMLRNPLSKPETEEAEEQ